jgi:hypothetical protein
MRIVSGTFSMLVGVYLFDDLKTLFVTAGGSLWSIRVKTPGKPVWP